MLCVFSTGSLDSRCITGVSKSKLVIHDEETSMPLLEPRRSRLMVCPSLLRAPAATAPTPTLMSAGPDTTCSKSTHQPSLPWCRTCSARRCCT